VGHGNDAPGQEGNRNQEERITGMATMFGWQVAYDDSDLVG
jgi:hypothetical protein